MTVLIIGASGHVGSAVARQAAADGIPAVGIARLPAPHVSEHIPLHLGDARTLDLGLPEETADELTGSVTSMVVATGRFDLSMSPADAQSSHLAPLRGALDFARRCKNLRNIVVVSSLLALGDTRQRLRSDLMPGQPRHRNFYEWAKLQGETIAKASELPVDVVRAGHVVVTEEPPKPTPPAALFELFRLLAAGWPLPVVGSNRYWSTPPDFAAQVVLDKARHGTGRSAVWAVDPASPTYAELFDVMNARFGFRAKRLRSARVARVVAAVIRPQWLDLPMSREVFDYCNAHWDLDLTCLNQLLATGRVTAPADRDYLIRSLDYEFTRLRGQLP